jgi:hypothetical protein
LSPRRILAAAMEDGEGQEKSKMKVHIATWVSQVQVLEVQLNDQRMRPHPYEVCHFCVSPRCQDHAAEDSIELDGRLDFSFVVANIRHDDR